MRNFAHVPKTAHHTYSVDQFMVIVFVFTGVQLITSMV